MFLLQPQKDFQYRLIYLCALLYLSHSPETLIFVLVSYQCIDMLDILFNYIDLSDQAQSNIYPRLWKTYF